VSLRVQVISISRVDRSLYIYLPRYLINRAVSCGLVIGLDTIRVIRRREKRKEKKRKKNAQTKIKIHVLLGSSGNISHVKYNHVRARRLCARAVNKLIFLSEGKHERKTQRVQN